jgi:tryptophan synthase beta chain
MGVKSSKQPPSFASFILRALTRSDARVPTVNPVVDWVNHAAVSTRTSLGVFDAAAVQGRLRLDLSRAGERFRSLGPDGEETLDEGHLVLRDDVQVLSLYGVRDSVHQAIGPHTREVVLLSCGVPGVALERVRSGLLQARRNLESLGPAAGRARPTAAALRAEAEPSPHTRGRLAGAWYGAYGGAFIPATLSPPLGELQDRWQGIVESTPFRLRLEGLLRTYVGRRTPLTLAANFSEALGRTVYLKREDLAHTGAHKVNNALGQALLAQAMGKRRVVAETGAGQHGVATAAACALLRLPCTVYMGSLDMQRQQSNVLRMRLMGARVVPVDSGSRTLKDAVTQALRDWVSHPDDTYYLMGSTLGPHPYPRIVREFQSVIGQEVREQFAEAEGGALPDALVACVGGGSNAIGLFHAFLDDASVRMFGVEAGGEGPEPGRHSMRLGPAEARRVGVLHGCRSYLLQDAHGQISATHSVAAGLDYAMLGPEHAHLHDSGRVHYLHATDAEAVAALELLARSEGIVAALESAHALAGARKLAEQLPASAHMVINLSGRGDKDLATIAGLMPGLSAEEPQPERQARSPA